LSPLVGRFKGIRLNRAGVCLEYDVAGSFGQEWGRARMAQGQPVVQRCFRLERVPRPFWLLLGGASSVVAAPLRFFPASKYRPDGAPEAQLALEPDGLRVVRVPASEGPVEFSITIGTGPSLETWELSPAEDADTRPERRWPQTLTTRGALSRASDAYVID